MNQVIELEEDDGGPLVCPYCGEETHSDCVDLEDEEGNTVSENECFDKCPECGIVEAISQKEYDEST